MVNLCYIIHMKETPYKVISRTPYTFSSAPKTAQICEEYGIFCWVEKREEEMTEQKKVLTQFVDLSFKFYYYYGLTYKGKDYICGESARDMHSVVKGIQIAEESLK